MKSWLKVGLRSWSTLLCFEIFYKTIGFPVMINLLDSIKTSILKAGGVSYISQENIGLVFGSPISVLLLLGAVLLITFYVYFEITALVLYCEAGWHNVPVSLWTLCRHTCLRALRVFHYKNLPVILLLLPVIALSAFPLTTGLLSEIQVPEFILDFIRENSLLFPLFLVFMALINILLFFYLFSFPAVILQGQHFIGSFGRSRQLLKGRKLKTAAGLFVCIMAFLLAAAAGFALMVLALWGYSKISRSADGGRSLFQFYYLKWSGIGSVAFSILVSPALSSAVVSMFHQYHGDLPPEPKPVSRNLRVLLYKLAAVAAAFLITAMYSETEQGGNLYFTANPETLIVAHRAGALFAPENTLAALETAIQSGADMAEIDVQQTRDGVLIVMHDSDFRRTAGLGRKVWETDYTEVERLDAGSFFSEEFAGERIPTLSQMLSAADGRIRLMIELKASGHETDLIGKTIREIREAGMEGQCILASMNLELLRRSKELAPEIETVYITALLVSDYDELDFVDGYSVETGSLTREMVIKAQTDGKKIYAWTANREKSIKKILRTGADGLVTDNPELAEYYLDYGDENILLQFLLETLYAGAEEMP